MGHADLRHRAAVESATHFRSRRPLPLLALAHIVSELALLGLVMKRWLVAFVMAISPALFVLALLHPAEMLAPGPLNAGHAGLKNDCFRLSRPVYGRIRGSLHCLPCDC